MTRRPLCASVFSVVILFAGTALAQSPADWIKRILDPAKIGVTVPEGASLNRKPPPAENPAVASEMMWKAHARPKHRAGLISIVDSNRWRAKRAGWMARRHRAA